jgi:hypothetical protein
MVSDRCIRLAFEFWKLSWLVESKGSSLDWKDSFGRRFPGSLCLVRTDLIIPTGEEIGQVWAQVPSFQDGSCSNCTIRFHHM